MSKLNQEHLKTKSTADQANTLDVEPAQNSLAEKFGDAQKSPKSGFGKNATAGSKLSS